MRTARPTRARPTEGRDPTGAMRAWPTWLCSMAVLGLGVGEPLTAADPNQMIQGTVTVEAGLAGQVAPEDRLIIKLYHPGNGVELDAKYRIVDDFTLPFDLVAAPSIDMSGRTKFQDYVVEVFTDRDGDVTSLAPDELSARTPEPVPLGTTGLRLELNALRQ